MVLEGFLMTPHKVKSGREAIEGQGKSFFGGFARFLDQPPEDLYRILTGVGSLFPVS